jgi:hypothetical protein
MSGASDEEAKGTFVTVLSKFSGNGQFSFTQPVVEKRTNVNRREINSGL